MNQTTKEQCCIIRTGEESGEMLVRASGASPALGMTRTSRAEHPGSGAVRDWSFSSLRSLNGGGASTLAPPHIAVDAEALLKELMERRMRILAAKSKPRQVEDGLEAYRIKHPAAAGADECCASLDGDRDERGRTTGVGPGGSWSASSLRSDAWGGESARPPTFACASEVSLPWEEQRSTRPRWRRF
jgi:hypothetical protein